MQRSLLAAIPTILILTSPLFSNDGAMNEPDAPVNLTVEAAAPGTGSGGAMTAEPVAAPGSAPASAAGQGDDSSYFFGQGDAPLNENEKLYESAFASRSDSSSGITEEQGENGRWSDQNIIPIFPELQVFDDVSNKTSLKRIENAQDYFLRARRQIQAGREMASQKKEEMAHATMTGYEWQKREKEASYKRQIRRLQSKHRRDAIGFLIKAMQNLDKVKNPAQLESSHYLDLKSEVFRMYVREQFKEKNLTPCIDVLVKYLSLKPGNAVEPEPHRLLAASYRHQEIMAEKMGNHKAHLEYKKLKNQHLVKYAELAYGRTSPQFSQIAERVRRDMIEVVP